MNSPWERDLAACRATLASDPDAARGMALKLLKEARNNGERVRATLTLAGVEKEKGQLMSYREEIERASRFQRPGPLARSELAGRWAQLHLYEADLQAAAIAANEAVDLASPLASAAPSYRRTFRAAAVVPRAAYAAALVTRAQVRVGQGMAVLALPDAVTALKCVDPRFSAHIHVAGLSTLGTILVLPGVATTPDVPRCVLNLCRLAQRILKARRIKARDPHRIMIRGIEALAMALLGSVDRAEALLERTIREFRKAGHERDAEVFVEHMVWLVGNRAGQTGRARLVAQRHGPTFRSVKRVTPPDDDEPIGF